MTVLGTTSTLGWGFYPVGDTYSLVPAASELHAVQSLLPIEQGELEITTQIRLERGFDWTGRIALTDLGLDLDSSADDSVPTGYVRTESAIIPRYGWKGSLSFTATPVMDEVDPQLWTGAVDITVPASMHASLGVNKVHDFTIRVILDGGSTPDFPVYVMVGTLVVRP